MTDRYLYSAIERRALLSTIAGTVPNPPYAAKPTERELWAFVDRIAQGNPMPQTDARKLLERKAAHATFERRKEAVYAQFKAHWRVRGNRAQDCPCEQCDQARAEYQGLIQAERGLT